MDRPLRVNFERPSGSGNPPSRNCPPKNCSHRKRDGNIQTQQDARDDLKVFSQARGARSLSALPGYAYDSRAGQGITVYVIDTGVNPDVQVNTTDYKLSIRLIHFQEFRDMQGAIRWLYLPGEPEIKRDDFGHGSCVTSKVTGPTFGVAKSANIVVVKIYPIDDTITVSRAIAVWGVAARDIVSKNMQRQAVVCTALVGEQSRS